MFRPSALKSVLFGLVVVAGAWLLIWSGLLYRAL